MSIRGLKLFLVLSLLVFASTSYARDPEVFHGNSKKNAKAPSLRLPDLAGNAVNLKDFRGQVVLINFWASWCPPCREEMPSIWRLQNEFRGKPFRIVAVNVDETKAEVNAFLAQQMKQDFVVLMYKGGNALKGWEVPAFPTTYIIDKLGRFRYRMVGPTEWDSFDNKKLVEKLLAEPARRH